MEKNIYKIEWEIPMLRAIYTVELEANSETEVKELFTIQHPRGRIRKMKLQTNKI